MHGKIKIGEFWKMFKVNNINNHAITPDNLPNLFSNDFCFSKSDYFSVLIVPDLPASFGIVAHSVLLKTLSPLGFQDTTFCCFSSYVTVCSFSVFFATSPHLPHLVMFKYFRDWSLKSALWVPLTQWLKIMFPAWTTALNFPLIYPNACFKALFQYLVEVSNITCSNQALNLSYLL